jgi:hypothetical protein
VAMSFPYLFAVELVFVMATITALSGQRPRH